MSATPSTALQHNDLICLNQLQKFSAEKLGMISRLHRYKRIKWVRKGRSRFVALAVVSRIMSTIITWPLKYIVSE